MMRSEFGDKDCSLSGIGGVEAGGDAAEFILLGADTVQVILVAISFPNRIYACMKLQKKLL